VVLKDSDTSSYWIFGIGRVISRCFGGEGSTGEALDLMLGLG
jgi:hypothetical protein